jgi:hypothetical protein
LASGPCRAHEVDQFTLPVGQEFADLGEYYNEYFITAIEEGVRRTNRRIDIALGGDGSQFDNPDPKYGSGVLRTYDTGTSGYSVGYLYTNEAVASFVRRSIPDAVTLIEGLERELYKPAITDKYPGKVVAFHPSDFDCIYAKAHFPLDPRSLFRLWRSSSTMAYGTYLGTDKIGHFVDMGYHYYTVYNRMRGQGVAERQAMYDAFHAFDSGLLSESSVLGYASAGAYSNADMTSNYVGCLFYRNLTEPVRLKGKLRPPAVVRDGEYWKLNDHVRGEPDFFSWFISDHYDEVLNPSHFEKGMQKAIRKAIKDRCESLRDWYTDGEGNHHPAGYFEDKMYELATYYNSDYGHSRKFDELLNLDKVCKEEKP